MRSTVKSLQIVATDRLPPPHTHEKLTDFCTGRAIKPKTAAGNAAAAAGWYVTSEQSLGSYTAVGIFNKAGDGTSGTCLIEDGNIVVFDGIRPRAIVYSRLAKEDEAGPVGGVVATTLPDVLRISDWTPGGPVADIRKTPDGVEVVPLAAIDPACGGKLQVPNVWGLTFTQARAKLARYGWRPVPYEETSSDPGDDGARDLRRQGIVEAEQCAPTGWGFCSAGYRHAGGATLSLATVGNPEGVSDYRVICPK